MFEIFSREREENFQEILTRIRKKAKERDALIEKNESIEKKVNDNSGSVFFKSWIEQINEHIKIGKDIESELKDDYKKLTDAELKRLPDYLLTLRRFL